jgi:hypothetical protein
MAIAVPLEVPQRLDRIVALAQGLENLTSASRADVVLGDVDQLKNLVFAEHSPEDLGKAILEQVAAKVDFHEGQVVFEHGEEGDDCIFAEVVVGEHQADEGEVAGQGFGKLSEEGFVEIAEIEVKRVEAVGLLLGLLGSEHLADVFHGLRRDPAVDRS